MPISVVNAEYEYELFRDMNGSLRKDRICVLRQRLQYLYYFIDQSGQPLLAEYELSSATADYLQGLGVGLPKFVKEGVTENWYGKLSNLELERKLNSKLHCYEFLRDRGELPPEVFFVKSPEEIRQIVSSSQKKTWILKSPFLYGGQGSVLIQTESDIPSELLHVHILEPLHSRVMDFSTYFDPASGETFTYLTRMNDNTTYQGGVVYTDERSMLEGLKDTPLYELMVKMAAKTRDYLNELKKYPLEQPVTIDGFIYRTGETLVGYPMSEINYRTSMGSLNRSLRRFLPEGGVGLYRYVEDKGIDFKKFVPYSTSSRTGIIELNDGHPQTRVIFLCESSAEKLRKLEHGLQLVMA